MKIAHTLPAFFSGEKLDIKAIDRYIDKLLKARVNLIYSMAFNSRYMQLSTEEIEILNTLLIEKCSEENLSPEIIIGHPVLATKQVLDPYFENMKKYSRRVSAISTLYPERYFPKSDNILEFMSYPSDFGFKVLVHEMKLISGNDGQLIDWPLETINACLEAEWCYGIKEDSKNDAVSENLIKKFSNRKVVIVSGGGKQRLLELKQRGLKGFWWLNGSSIISPQLGMKFEAALNGVGDDSSQFLKNYLDDFEVPFFHIVNELGWHVAFRLVLSEFGFRNEERFPMPTGDRSLLDEFDIELKAIKSFVRKNQ